MALSRTQKASIVAKLQNAFEKAQSVVFLNFHGLGVSETNEVRGALREKGVVYAVVKKSLLKRVLADSKTEGEMPALEGEVAIIYGDDPVVPANSMAEFIKRHKEHLSILGGIFEHRYMDKVQMEEIVSIPPLETLRGMFVNVINAPIAGLAVALSAIAEKKS